MGHQEMRSPKFLKLDSINHYLSRMPSTGDTGFGAGFNRKEQPTPMTTQQPNPETVSTESASTEEIVTTELIEDSATVNHVEIIETVISSLDQENTAMVSQNEEGHLWKFKYGSVEVFVQLTGSTDDDTFTVWSSVLQLPAKNEPQLMRKLLEMNWSDTFEAHFAIVDNQVVVLSTRTVAELSAGEISRSITVVATIADDNDDALHAEFGAA
ncbi:MAG TPA: YbjN domain-containing protein [Coleofasciculaceae cyanobacterium]